jgi:hypothetical protein
MPAATTSAPSWLQTTPKSVPVRRPTDLKPSWRKPNRVLLRRLRQRQSWSNPAVESELRADTPFLRAFSRAIRIANCLGIAIQGGHRGGSQAWRQRWRGCPTRCPCPGRTALRLGRRQRHQLAQAERPWSGGGRCQSSVPGSRTIYCLSSLRGRRRLQLGLIRSAEPISNGLKCRFHDSAQSSRRIRFSEITAGADVQAAHGPSAPAPNASSASPAGDQTDGAFAGDRLITAVLAESFSVRVRGGRLGRKCAAE